MPYATSDASRYGSIAPYRRHVWSAFLLLACSASVFAAPAHRGEPSQATNLSQGAAEPMAMQVKNDRLTLEFTKVPQVYLVGMIDADAPQRFSALVASGKIPVGSDVYLNSSGGDARSSMALGRLFRDRKLVTHLGTPRRALSSGSGLNTAVCKDACIYAYLGGFYRFAPTGSDRIGLPATPVIDSMAASSGANGPGQVQSGQAQSSHAQASYAALGRTSSNASQPSADDIVSYLKEMGIKPAAFATAANASTHGVAWLTADQMMAAGLANNGRLPLMAKYELSSAAPYLSLSQVDRQGEHRIMIQCKPGSVTLTAYDLVGAQGARAIVASGTRSYFEINRQETLTQQRDGASVANESVTIARAYPPNQLGRLVFAQSIGAWVGGRTNAFRSGFTFQLDSLKGVLKDYYNACWRAAPWPVTQNS